MNASMNTHMITIEVVYGTSTSQTLLELAVEESTTVIKAIEQSGILNQYPEIDIHASKVGVWNRVVKPTTALKDGDRIEIYRPLIADPKEVRKRRAEKAIEEGRADKVTGGRPSRLRAKD
jgi:putative ubiquitin-RnfH superfamily antitoxin RatB of RatAB toxin-antitoxin module